MTRDELMKQACDYAHRKMPAGTWPLLEVMPRGEYHAALTAAYLAGVAAEREACAKVIDERADDWKRTWEAFLASGHQGPATSWEAIYRGMAAAIRARA